MGKHDRLSAEEMDRFSLSGGVLGAIETCGVRLGLTVPKLRVLDYGCGRGRSVAKLRQKGFQAFGVDVDAEPVLNGRPYLMSLGLDAERVLQVIGHDGATDFPDGFFHFVFSEQVFEHMRHIETVTAELRRLTAPGGGGYHVLSAPRRLVEEHLRIPFLHWLPKNGLRRAWLRFWCRFVKDPAWAELKGLSSAERADTYYRYSVEKTFYRRAATVQHVFQRHFAQAEFDVPEWPHQRGIHAWTLAFARRISRRLYGWLYLNTLAIRLATVK